MTWAQRLKRVFSIDVETCVRCGKAVRVITSIEESGLIERILAHVRANAQTSTAAVDGAAGECVSGAHGRRANLRAWKLRSGIGRELCCAPVWCGGIWGIDRTAKDPDHPRYRAAGRGNSRVGTRQNTVGQRPVWRASVR